MDLSDEMDPKVVIAIVLPVTEVCSTIEGEGTLEVSVLPEIDLMVSDTLV